MAIVTQEQSVVTVLHGIPYKVYSRMTRLWANRHLRMAYHDGTLEVVSPKLRLHKRPSDRLRIIVRTVADRLGLPYDATGSYTYRKGGDGPFKGKGKEPDQSFYFGSVGLLPRDRDPNLDAGDPPPDLWIEVDNRVSSAGRLPVYASLGVPEVWRYRARRRTLQFLHLVDGAYEPIEESLALPVLTSTLVLEALALGENLLDSEWARLFREWVDRTFLLPQAGA
jgi:Uma2 family endonuclease